MTTHHEVEKGMDQLAHLLGRLGLRSVISDGKRDYDLFEENYRFYILRIAKYLNNKDSEMIRLLMEGEDMRG